MMSRHFENWIKAYMNHTRFSEAPDAIHFWTAISTVAGALRRRVWIDMLHFQWTPNFYIVLVGPPGVVTKSTCINIGMRMLEKLPDVTFGPQSMTWQALTKSLSDAVENVIVEGPEGKKINIPISCLTIPVSELGTFLKPDDSAMIDALTDLWDGQLSTWRHRTVTQGQTEIKNPWLNIIGATTPSWLRTHFPEHMIGGGLTSRVIFVYGETKRHLVAYPSLEVNGYDYRSQEKLLIEDLKEIAKLKGPLTLSSEALSWGKKWYEQHWTIRPEHMASDRYGGYIARKQAHIHKLAIILSCVKRTDLIIELEDLQEAASVIDQVEPHMSTVFESIGVVPEAKHVAEILAFLRVYPCLPINKLWSLVQNIMSSKDFQTSLAAAIKGGRVIHFPIIEEGKKVNYVSEKFQYEKMQEQARARKASGSSKASEPPPHQGKAP